jgi:PKD repeat protein
MRREYSVGLAVLGVALIAAASLLPVVARTDVPPAVPTPGEVKFTASGDFSGSARATAVFQRVRAMEPDLHLALGDLSYGATGQEQAWCDQVLAGVGPGFPFELISGNHEMNGQNGNINEFSACLPNQLPGLVGVYGREWYVDVPQSNPLIRFVMISPNLSFPVGGAYEYAVGSPHYNWTATAIDGARAKSIPWVVVGMHKPCLSLGEYSCEPGTDLNNLLMNKRVDLVLHGHEHLYQRTKQLATNAGCTAVAAEAFDPDCVTDADNQLTKGAGTVFATVGTGGQALREVRHATDPEAPYFATWAGSNVNPTWGSLNITANSDTLTASFDRADGGTFTDNFVISSAGQANNPPVARWTQSCSGLTCALDASTSSDTDGVIASYSWDFGDGTNASGPTASHVYADPGSYTVRLTVTDDDGDSNSAVGAVTVASTTTLASDTFNRTVTGGLGAAQVGGSWTVAGGTTNTSVNGTQALLRINAQATVTATLQQVSSMNTDLALGVAADKVSTGSGLYLSVIGRRVGTTGDYRAKVRLLNTGGIGLSLVRTSSGAETSIAGETSSGVQYAAGDRINARIQVTGSGPTTIRARVWKAGTPEPVTWQRSVTDTTAGLQAAGSVGVSAYLSGAATNSPITVSLDDLTARTP